MEHNYKELRKFPRLKFSFPLEFKLLRNDKGDLQELCGWKKGFTYDVGKRGLRLHTHDLKDKKLVNALKENKLTLEIRINRLFLTKNNIKALCSLKWIEESKPGFYIMGLMYENINIKDNRNIIKIAYIKRIIVKTILFISGSIIIFLLLKGLKG